MIENDNRNQERGKSSGDADKRAGRKPGLRVSIHVEPDPAVESQDPPIPFVWTPIPHEPFDYDPFGVRPRPQDIPFDEPAWTIVWETPVSTPPPGACFPGRCSCGGSLPPGKWLDHDPAGFTQGTINGTLNGITGSPTDSGTYTLDSVGNMTTFGSGSRTVNAQNELTSGPYTPGYDADGNLTSGLPAVAAGSPVSLSLVYDAWNDVVGIRNVSGVPWESFYYDANGLRYESALSISPNTVTMTTFSASGEALEDDQGSGASEVRVTYVWGIPYVNDLVSLDQATGFFPLLVHHEYADTDANFDVTSIVYYNGSLIDAFTYQPYGKLTIISSSGPAADYNFLYQGGRYDSLDQTYLFGRRTEAPSIGTWVQKDPAGYVDGANTFEFVANNPLSRLDPSGREYQDIASAGFNQPELTVDNGHTRNTIIASITIRLQFELQAGKTPLRANLRIKYQWYALSNGWQHNAATQMQAGLQYNGTTSALTYTPGTNGGVVDSITSGTIDVGDIGCGETRTGSVNVVVGSKTQRPGVIWIIKFDVMMDKIGKLDGEVRYVNGPDNWAEKDRNGNQVEPYPYDPGHGAFQ